MTTFTEKEMALLRFALSRMGDRFMDKLLESQMDLGLEDNILKDLLDKLNRE